MSPGLGGEIAIGLLGGSSRYGLRPPSSLRSDKWAGSGWGRRAERTWLGFPAEGLGHDSGCVVVIGSDGGVAAGLGGRDSSSVLASVAGQPDDVTGGARSVVGAVLPGGIEAVAFRGGRLRCWQKPVKGVAAFPWPGGFASDHSLVGFDTAGEVQLRASSDLRHPACGPGYRGRADGGRGW